MDERTLIFSNLLNGVPARQVAEVFRKPEEEVMQIFSFILRKIKSYCFLRARQKDAYPIIVAHDVETAQAYRLTCLKVLPKLNLDTAPQFKDIQNEVVTPDNVISIASNLRA